MQDRDLKNRIEKCFAIFKEATKNMEKPLINQIIDLYGKDPFLILIGCLLSLRARDKITIFACTRLFEQAKTPKEILDLPDQELLKAIGNINYYKTKAQTLKRVSRELIERFNSKVPNTKEDLLSIKGIGPKTTNLVLSMAFDIPEICVDTHVHRISNRLGWVSTTTPEQTEKALKLILPKKYWIQINYYLVMWGQNICVPISPFCSVCPLSPLCPKIGVKKRR